MSIWFMLKIGMIFVDRGGECLKAQTLELYESKLMHGVLVS